MYRVELPITLTIKAPFMTQSSTPGAYGLDSSLARDADGHLMIAAAHVTGKLREAWEELRSALVGYEGEAVPTCPEIDTLLGRELAEGQYTPQAKSLFFTDFVISGSEPSEDRRHRIEIDALRGAVCQGQLMILESRFGAGELLDFKGILRFETQKSAVIQRIENQVRCGLQWVPQMGAFRTIGFGRLHSVFVGPPEKKKYRNRIPTVVRYHGLRSSIGTRSPLLHRRASPSRQYLRIPGRDSRRGAPRRSGP